MLTFDYVPGLSKEKILHLVTEKDIIEHFLGDKIPFNKPILSPFRQEKTPSVTFKQINNKIVFKDWGSGLYGDAFTFVQKMYNCSFTEALHIIDSQLSLNLTNLIIDIKPKEKELEFKHLRSTNYSNIVIDPQIFTLADYGFWRKYGITISTLNNYEVKSCKNVWINDRLVATYSSGNPIYAYTFRNNDKVRYKIYRPHGDKRGKWMCNVNPDCVEGMDQLNHLGGILILTKSLKDVMCLRELGYDAISLHGESNEYPVTLHDKLMKRFDEVVVFYDNDEAGLFNGNRISKNYNLRNIFIPVNSGDKDISDFIKNNGIEKARKLMSQLLAK